MAGKVALVTGASRGIGLETARALVARGWKVGLLARDEARLHAAIRQDDAASMLPLIGDVTDARQVADAASLLAGHFGQITALVNNAGVIEPVGRFLETKPVAWEQLQRINLDGVAIVIRAVLPAMLAAGRGVVVNLSSGAAHDAVLGWSAYCTSKSAVRMLTLCLARDYEGTGVRFHNFIPGVVRTDLLTSARRQFDNTVARLDDAVQLPPEIPARVIAWLVDEGDDQSLEVEQTIRDKVLRDLVGLEERASW